VRSGGISVRGSIELARVANEAAINKCDEQPVRTRGCGYSLKVALKTRVSSLG
jgi:hypothetical protein